jgi:hypothetical protein
MNLFPLIALLFIHPYEKQLEWSDFKGPINQMAVQKGMTAETTIEWVLQDSAIDGKVYFELKCNFIPEQSWTVTSSPKALIHENAHLSIALISSRLFTKQLLKYQGVSESKSQHVKKLFNSAWKQYLSLQRLFDMESQNGVNETTERIWESNIAKEIINLK